MDKEHLKNQTEKDVLEAKRGIIAWLQEHVVQIMAAGLSITALIAIVYGFNSRQALHEWWIRLQDTLKEANKYSSDWFKNATKEELDCEREKIRKAFCASGKNFDEGCRLQNLLRRFDEELSKRTWGNEVPRGPSIHREHGWYLPNDD